MLQIALPPETEAALRERASANGEDASEYAVRLLKDALGSRSVEELLAPFRQQVKHSGATDAELDTLCDELREEVWLQRGNDSKRKSLADQRFEQP
jgi:hypothetical protein